MSASPPDLVGQRVAGRYRVLEKLGQGGMGAVYTAEQEPLERRVALKVLGGKSTLDAEARERFVREARAASRLNHPNIATVYDFGAGEEGPYLAMELVEGRTLKRVIAEEAPIPWRRAVNLVTQVARGLAVAHAQGIVHRDIKPANLIVTELEGQELVKILDFGLANLTDDDPELTETGVVMGTAAYMSPEQCRGVRNDVRTDLYALGVILFEMLAGRRPFLDKGASALVLAHATLPPPALGPLAPGAPPALCALVDRLLSKDPAARPDDGGVLVRVLDSTSAALDSGAHRTGGFALPPLSSDHAPEGEVALVFTDIESSSSLWERAPRAMREALDVHDAVMRETLRAAGGYEVKTQGDSFMVSFFSADDAAGWALEVQRALLRQDWPAGLELGQAARAGDDAHKRVPGLRVRVGVHLGRPDCRRNPNTGRMDYFGGVVNRAARIESAAWGGQVLLSAEVAAALRGLDELDARLEPRGAHRLKGIEEPVELFELVDERGPPRTFPPPRTEAAARKTNLHEERTRFVGREAERDQLRSLLDEGVRLVTLLGPGGTGKTRLSRQVARELLDEGGVDEAWFCDLSEARDADALTADLARALGVTLAAGERTADAVELVARALARRGAVLLVVDNLEQVVAAAPETVGVWLQRAPELRCIATSREPLGVAGEHRFELDPLEVELGAQLFRARVEELGRPPPDDDAAVRELVAALDGMPLAIELAASRAGLMSPRQILERMSRRFDLLRGGRRDVSARQATLRGAIDWSWELLDAAERDAFAQCAVFAGGFSIEAAEEVLDLSARPDAPFILDLVQALKEKSLLRAAPAEAGELRLTMLQSLKDYAAEKLAADPVAESAAFARHADFYVREARRRSAPLSRGDPLAMAWLGKNRDNLLAAHARLVDADPATAARALLAVDPWLRARESTARHRELLDAAVACARRAGEDALLADALIYRGELESERGDAGLALELAEEALARLEPAAPLRAVALVLQSRALTRLGRRRDAWAALDEAEPIAKQHGMITVQIRITMSRGLRELAREVEHDHFDSALRLARRIGQRELEGRILTNLGIEHMLQGRLEEAAQKQREAIEVFRDAGLRGLEGLSLGNLGSVMLSQGLVDEAEAVTREAVEIHREVGNRLLEGADIMNLAAVLLRQRRLREARATGEAAWAILQETRGDRELLLCSGVLIAALAALGEVDAARAYRVSSIDGDSWNDTMSYYGRLADAALAVAEARAAGKPVTDPALDPARALVEELRDQQGTSWFLRTDLLERQLAEYPALPEDRSSA